MGFVKQISDRLLSAIVPKGHALAGCDECVGPHRRLCYLVHKPDGQPRIVCTKCGEC